MGKAVNLAGFVNVFGQPIVMNDGASFKRRARPKPTATTADESKHLGWQATGFSPAQVQAAERAHEAKSSEPFDAAAWMNGATPKAARSQPYATPSSANECAALLTKAGWLRVVVTEVIKK